MFNDIKMGLERPATAEDIKEQAELNGMRAAIERGSRDSHLIRSCLDMARYQGLSGEDKYVVLAYQALLALEDFHKRTLRFMELSPSAPPLILKNDGTLQE